MRTLAALSLAVGIGLASALLSIVDAVLLRPLPVARPHEILRVFTASQSQPYGLVSYPDFQDLPGAVAQCLIPVAVGDPARMQLALAVTPDYFQALGVAPRFGRLLSMEDERANVAVLAHGAASDVGKTLRVAGKPYLIVGVAPEHFGLDRFLHEDFYIPIRSYGDGQILLDRSRRFLTVYTRGAAPELEGIGTRLEREHPQSNRGRRIIAMDELTARVRTDKMMTPLAALLGSLAFLILLIACANACGALLMRGGARVKETALKMALGASPARLLCESLKESAAIAGAGCALGLPLAWVTIEALRRSTAMPSDFSISVAARIDGRVALAAMASAAVCTIACGLAPRLLPINVWSALKSHERGASKGRARKLLAMVNVALAAALTASGGSLWLGLRAAQNVDLGYRTKEISVITFDPSQQGFNESQTRGFYRELTERAKALPGVRGVALAQSVPLGMTGAQKQIRIRDEEEMTVWSNIVSPEYFTRMRMPLVSGRAFDDRDGAVAIVNQELAKRVRIGEKMFIARKSVEVVGIVKTAKYMRWDEAPRPFVYLPYSDNYVPRMTLHVEAPGDVFAAVRALARGVPASDARPLQEYFDNGAMFGVKIALKIAGVVGAGGLLLALAGLYGVVASSARRRRREIGIRLALGATAAGVVKLIGREAICIAALGTAAGLLLAASGSRLLRSFVPGSGQSLWSGVVAAVLMAVACLIASAVPAIKALRLDPAKVLREE